MRRYHIILRQCRYVTYEVEAESMDAAATKCGEGKATEVSDVTGDFHLHEVEGPVPEGFNPRFNYDDVYEDRDEEEPLKTPFSYSANLIYWCRPIFDQCVHPDSSMMNHNEVKRILEHEGVIQDTDDVDSESGAIYFYWKTREDANAFIDRLNAWTEAKLKEVGVD